MCTLTLLCRFCAKEQHQQSIINLKTDKINGHSIMQKLSLYNEEIVDFTNKCLPETMCIKCYNILNTSYDFFVQVRESQVVLKRLCTDAGLKNDSVKMGFVNLKKEFDMMEYSSIERDTKPDTDSCDTVDPPICWSTYPWCCAHCNAKLPSMQAVREHSQKDHGTCNGFQCSDCGVKTNGFQEFVEHVRQKRKELVKYCEYCDMEMKTPKHREMHISDQICTYCGQIFTNESSLHIHLKKYMKKPAEHLTFNMEIEDIGYRIEEKTFRNDSLGLTNYTYQDAESRDEALRLINDVHKINYTTYKNDMIGATNDTYQDYTDHIDDALSIYNTIDIKNEKTETVYESNIMDMKITSWSDYPHICKYCNIKVAYTDILKEHCMMTHKRCFAMKCVDCDRDNVDTFEEFVQHVKVHRPYLKSICPYCNSKISDFEESHIQTHMGRYQCSICSENFRGSRDLRRHDNKLENPALKPPVERRKGPITDKDITCNICGKRMKTPLSLRAHKIILTERKRNHTCDRCGKAFYTKASMEAHYKIHEDTEKETCKICDKSFLTVQRLRKHVKTHNLEMPFQCDDCKKFFSSKDSLRAHVTVHTNVKPYECQYCFKKFRNKHTMKTHENQHTGARPYSCDVCCINFACWSNCDKHMRRIHGTPLAKTVKTPHGKLAIDPETGRPSKVSMTSVVKEWSKSILEKSLRKCKRKNQGQ